MLKTSAVRFPARHAHGLRTPSGSLRYFTHIRKRDHASHILPSAAPIHHVPVPGAGFVDAVPQDVAMPALETPPPSPPVVPSGGDVKKRAFGLDERVVEMLTPTLKKFCLNDRVAIVTG